MSTKTSVVSMWRRRAQRLARQGWACADCGRSFLVRRRACPVCGSVAGFRETPLPVRGTVRALTRAGASVEHLDQVTDHKPMVMLDLEGGHGFLTCLAAWSDAAILDSLRNASLRLTVRRIPLGHLPAGEPIPYGLKATADLRTRLDVKEAQKQSSKEG